MAKNYKLYLVVFTLFLCGSTAQENDIAKLIQQLTSMLPQLTKARSEDIPALLNKTLSQVMRSMPDSMKNLQLEALLPFLLPNTASSSSKADISKMVNTIQDSMVNPLQMSLAKCAINPLKVSSITFAKLMMKCVNISSDMSLSKVMKMDIATLMTQPTLGEIAKVLNLTLKDLGKLSPTAIVKMVDSAISQKTGILHSPLQFAAALNNMKMDQLMKMTILDLASMLSKLSPQLLFMNMNSTQRLLLNITINNLPSFVMTQLKMNVTLNAILTASLSDIVSALTSRNPTIIQNSMSKGILSIAKLIPLVQVNQYFDVAKAYMNSLNLTSVIKMIPGMKNMKVENFGILTLSKLINKGEALLLNNKALQKLLASSNTLEEMVPVAISTALSMMPKQFLNFLFNFKNVSNIKMLSDMTVSDLIKYGPWMTNDVSKFLTKQKISLADLDSIKLSTLLKAFNMTVNQLEQFTVAQLLTTISKSVFSSGSLGTVNGIVNKILSYANNLTLVHLANMIPSANKAGNSKYLNMTFTKLIKTAESSILKDPLLRNILNSNGNSLDKLIPPLIASALHVMPPQVHKFLGLFQNASTIRKLNTMSMSDLMKLTTWTNSDVEAALKSVNISMPTFQSMKVAKVLQAFNISVDKLPKLNIGEIASMLTSSTDTFKSFNQILNATTAYLDRMRLADLANYIPGLSKKSSGEVLRTSVLKLVMMGEKSVFNSTVLQKLIGDSKTLDQLMPTVIIGAISMIPNNYLTSYLKISNVTDIKKLGNMNFAQVVKLFPWMSNELNKVFKMLNISLNNLDSIKMSSVVKALNMSWDKIEKMKVTDISSMIVDLAFKSGSLKELSKLFNVSKDFLDKTRIIDLANYIPGIQKVDTSKLFTWTLLELVKIGESTMLNSSILHDAINSSKTVEELVPAASVLIAKMMYALQPQLNPLYNLLKSTENLRRTGVGRIPLSELVKVVQLNSSDIEKWLKIMQTPLSLVDINKLATLLKSLNSTAAHLENANMMEIAAMATKTAMESARIFKLLESLNMGNAHSSMLQLINLANQIISGSKVDLTKMIKMNFQQLIMKGETSLFNTSVLLSMLGPGMSANDLIPAVMAKMMSFLPKEYARFLNVFKGVDGAKNLANTTLSDLISPWNAKDVKKLMDSLKIPTAFFDSLKLSQFLKAFNTTLRQLESISILRMAAAINKTVSNVGPVIKKMQMQLSSMATQNNVSLDKMLNQTIFQILGLKPDQMRQLGLLDMLPAPVSQDLLNLFNKTSIGQLEKSFRVILNMRGTSSQKYSYTILQVFLTAMSLDTANVTAMIVKMLPIGKASLAALLNTSEAFIMSQRYLTEFYPILKKAISSIVNKSSPFYYKNLFSHLLTMTEFQQFLGKTFFSQMEMIRKLIVKSAIDMNAKAAIENARKVAAAIAAAMQKRFKEMQNMMGFPLDTLIKRCSLDPSRISSKTLVKVMLKCINVSTDFPLSKLIRINTAVLINEITIQELSDMMNATLKDLTRLSASAIIQKAKLIIASRTKMMHMPLIYAADARKMSMKDMMEMKVLDVGPLISNLPKKLANRDINTQPLMVTMKSLLDDLMSSSKIQFTANAMSLLSFMDISKYLLSKNQTYLMNAVSKGLIFASKEMSMSKIKRMYNIDSGHMNRLTLYDLAYHISGKNKTEFADIFKLSPQHMTTINKASMSDCNVLLKLSDSQTTTENMNLMQMKDFLIGLPVSISLVLERTEDIAKSKNMLLQDMTLSDVQKFGSWKINDVNKLLSAVNVPRKYFDEAKRIKFSNLKRILHTTLTHLGKLNVIRLNAALCSTGNRYNGSACVAFKGCDDPSSASLCKVNAECDNMIGSYLCRCKIGFAGDGTNCYDACQKKRCPDSAECYNVPDSGSVCRCSKPLHVIRKNKCVSLPSKVFKIAGTKFNQKFNQKYSDKSSKEFKNKAAELENVLYTAVCSKIQGCSMIQVTSIRKGSIVVDYNVITDANAKQVTASVVQNVATEALNDPALAILKPDLTSLPSAQTSDICQSGGDDCGPNSVCVSNSQGGYTCSCNSGYVNKGNTCSKVNEANVVAIVVPITIGLLLLLLISGAIIYKRRRGKKIELIMEAESTISYSKAASLEMEDRGIMNDAYQ